MVSRLCFIAVLSTAPFFAISASAAPASRPLSPDADKVQSQIAAVAEAARLPSLPATRPSDIIRLSIINNMLQLDALIATPGMFHVLSGDPRVVTTVRQTPVRTAAERAIFLVINDFSPAGTMMVQTTVAGGAGPTQIIREFESDHVSGTIELLQDPPTIDTQGDAQEPVRLKLEQRSDPPNPSDFLQKFSARTFVELRRQHPGEVSERLGPIFRDLHQPSSLTLDPAGAWQVLAGGATLDAGAVEKIKRLIPKLGSDSFTERRAAMQSLQTIGEPAALVLMKMDRAGWSAEQSNAVDTFLAPFEPFDSPTMSRLADDQGYLLSIQYSDDASLRGLAAQRLAKVLGHPVDVDSQAADAVRLPAVQKLQATFPTTRGNN